MVPDFVEAILPQLADGAAHTRALGFVHDGVDGDRVRLRVPWRDDLVGDPATGVLAGGLVTTALDHVGGLAVWLRLRDFRPLATLDLRVDYLRGSTAGSDLLVQAHCSRITRSVAFVQASAHEGDADDPVALSQAVYMLTQTA